MTDLTSILHELSEFAPERVKYIHAQWYMLRNNNLAWVHSPRNQTVDLDRMAGACMEECEALGWSWVLSYSFTGNHDAAIFRSNDLPSHFATAGSACLAIATALLMALKAEKPQPHEIKP